MLPGPSYQTLHTQMYLPKPGPDSMPDRQSPLSGSQPHLQLAHDVCFQLAPVKLLRAKESTHQLVCPKHRRCYSWQTCGC